MKCGKLVPRLFSDKSDLTHHGEEYPLSSFQHEINQLFGEFFNGFDPSPFRADRDLFKVNVPKIDIAETADEIRVEAELPGLDEKDVEVTFADQVLTIRGEKKSEEEQKKKDCCWTERSYGTFERSISIGAGVDEEKVKASLKKGVLTVTLPKTTEAKKDAKKIQVNGE